MISSFLSQQLSDQMLQKIAQEMNLSDTGFILEKNGQDMYSQGQQTRNTKSCWLILKLDAWESTTGFDPTSFSAKKFI